MPSIVKISELPELTTPADGDNVVIEDISEVVTIDKTKRITVANLVVAKITAALAAYAPKLITKRQGGSGSDWDAGGTTNYTPSVSLTKIQAGSAAMTFSAESLKSVDVTFPTAFTYKPIVFLQVVYNSGISTYPFQIEALTYNIRTTAFNLSVGGGTMTGTLVINWLAIGE